MDYEVHGTRYAAHRRADPRIAAMIVGALGDAKTVINVGAGAGSYEPVDRAVFAVEPSAMMRRQRPISAAPAVAGVAESLPFKDKSVDAAMSTYSVHQWPDLLRGLREMRRVVRGPIVVMAGDPTVTVNYWLAEYAPEMIDTEARRFPSVDQIVDGLGGTATVDTVPIPFDCTDGFMEAFYGRPERFLDDGVRQSQSAWSFLDDTAEARAVERLRASLESGEWDRRYGELRTAPEFLGSLRLITALP